MTTTANTKGSNDNTGTVHYARRVEHWDHETPAIMQHCGYGHSQRYYLRPEPADAEVTCRRCLVNPPKAAKVTTPRPAARTYGRQEWRMVDLRTVAKLRGIKGYTTMTGDELLDKIIAEAPQFA